MRKIVYYVASSIDGFISGLNDDISGFVGAGNGVDKYLADLANFDTVIMGRNTYEFGYQYGLQPGQPVYPNMKHYIFSNSLKLENPNPQVQIKRLNVSEIDKLQMEEGTDIYLCGGGRFAGWLLDNQKIDILKLKLNPLILGEGIKLFGNSSSKYKLKLVDSSCYENGLQIMTFNVIYLLRMVGKNVSKQH
jgi:dihydrofolate reductase